VQYQTPTARQKAISGDARSFATACTRKFNARASAGPLLKLRAQLA
jgi:hypothetical protein